jgi:hypothetical protein
MIWVKIAFAIIFAVAAAYVGERLFKTVLEELRTGRSAACREVFERGTDPARYWISLIGQLVSPAFVFVLACLLVIASLKGTHLTQTWR